MTTDAQASCPVTHEPTLSTRENSRGRRHDIDPHDLDMVAFSSDEKTRAREAILAIDTAMRAEYADLKSRLMTNLSPVVIVNNDPTGGEYVLIHNGTQETIQPISQIFEIAKSVAHVPLALFSILAPYLKGSDTTAWEQGITDFASTLREARAGLEDAGLPEDLETSCSKILDDGLAFIDKSLDLGYVSIRSFQAFAGGVYDSIRTNMWHASDAQITGVRTTLNRWKKQVGAAQWKDLYVVVLSIWTTSVLNQNSIIIREFMNPANVDTHLIDIPTAEIPDDYVYVALENLARIVQDNVAAEMIFPTDQKVADALKGTEDLLSDTILQQMHCPYPGVQGAQAERSSAQVGSTTLSV